MQTNRVNLDLYLKTFRNPAQWNLNNAAQRKYNLPMSLLTFQILLENITEFIIALKSNLF